jgi:hypothetical protein
MDILLKGDNDDDDNNNDNNNNDKQWLGVCPLKFTAKYDFIEVFIPSKTTNLTSVNDKVNL